MSGGNSSNRCHQLDDKSTESNEEQKAPSGPSAGPSDKCHPPDDSNSAKAARDRPACLSKSSAPIDIRQASCGKFGVFQARPLPSQSPQIDPATGLVLDSNGEPVPIDKLIKTANSMSSMMMAHKIALEDDFRLEPGIDISGPLMSLSPIIGSSPTQTQASGSGQQGEPSLHSRVKDIVHEAYWDLFKEELDSQKDEDEAKRKYDLSKQLLMDIKRKILELLLPQHARLKQDVEDKLDLKMIDQLTQVHAFKPIDYGLYVLSVLSKLCAPVRDEKLTELSETTDVVQLYRGIMELLELMRLDLANFTLSQFKPHIKAQSQNYEREKFNEILKQQRTIGIDGLEYTRIWLARAVERVDSNHGLAELVHETKNSQELVPGDDDQQPQAATASSQQEMATATAPAAPISPKQEKILRSAIVNRVLNAAYCELLEWRPQLQKLYPETLLFDESTFKQLSEQYKVLTLTAAILLTTFAFVNRFKIPDSKEFKVLIKSHVITLLTATYETSQATTAGAKLTQSQDSIDERLDTLKLETVAMKVCEDVRQKIEATDKTMLGSFEEQRGLLKRQILDLQGSQNRVRELARRRILEFVETLLDLDVKHQQKLFPSKMPPPVNIPLGLNCLTDEITLTMAQLVKIIRYNRRVFFHHYQDIITEQVAKFV